MSFFGRSNAGGFGASSGGFGNSGNTGGFGNSGNTGGFGTSNTNNNVGGFGSSSNKGFGGGFGNTQTNNNANKGFGSSAGGFGTTQNSSSGFGGGGFGQQSNPTQTMNASQGFGNNQNTGFGAVNPANPANNAMNLRQASPLNGTDVATNQFNDGVSCLAFSPNMQSLQQYWGNVQEVLLSGHWDNTVQIWTVNTIANQQCSVGQRNDMTSDVSLLSVQAPAKGPTGQHQAPVLSVAWHGDCTRYFSGSADQTVKMWSAQAPGQSQDVGKHNGAVTHICVPNTNHGCSLPGGVGAHCVISAGADNVIKYWDIRQKRQIAEVRMNGKVACMDLRGDLLVAACRDPNNPKNQNLQIFHLSKPQQVYRTLKSPLTHQIMSLSCFPDQKGFCIGSIEGRVSVQHVATDDRSQKANFSFRCHRYSSNPNIVYPVSCIEFNQKEGTFVTAGSDGVYCLWDKDSKQSLKKSHHNTWHGNKAGLQRGAQPTPISAVAYNYRGNILAYAESYDWYKGANGRKEFPKDRIVIHALSNKEIKRKTPKR